MAEGLINIYKAKSGQSIFDVCLQTYGTLDYLFKLLIENNVSNINQAISQGQVFSFDTSLTVDTPLYQDNIDEDVFYITSKKSATIGTGVALNIELQEDGSPSLEEDGSVSLRE